MTEPDRDTGDGPRPGRGGTANHPLVEHIRRMDQAGDGAVVEEPLDDRRRQSRALATELRRIIEDLVQTDAPLDELVAATERAQAFAARLAELPRRRSYQGVAEASIGMGVQFLDRSPVMGLANPVAPPLVLTRVRHDAPGPDGPRIEIEAHATLSWTYEGPPGSVHGGFVAALFDDALGSAMAAAGVAGFTGTLTVRYRNPTPLATDLLLTAWVDRFEGRKLLTGGTIHARGVLCAEAEAIFVLVSQERLDQMMAARLDAARDPG